MTSIVGPPLVDWEVYAPTVIRAARTTEHAAYLPPSRIVLPPLPTPQVGGDSDVIKELREFLTELERLQHVAVEWGKRNPVVAWFLMLIASALLRHAVDALLQ